MLSYTIILVLSVFTLSISAINLDYGLMFDAGSSGTKAHIFAWPRSSNGELYDVRSAPWDGGEPWILNMKSGVAGGTGGINDFAFLPHKAGPKLNELFDFAKDKLGSIGLVDEDFAKIPVFLKATAGMRMVYENHPDNATAILDSCRDTAEASGFRFERSWFQILPGEDEGVFGWVSVNYLLGTLDAENPERSVAAADMGGASTQLTFVPEEAPLSDSYVLRMGDKSIVLYTHSYLSFGQDQMLFRYQAALAANANANANSVDDPCLWTGATVYAMIDDVNVTFTGKSDFSTCQQFIMDNLLGLDVFCGASPCGLQGEYSAPIPDGMSFYTFNGFYHTADFFGIDLTSDVSVLADAAKATCDNTSWSQIQKDNPGIPAQYMYWYCTNAGYYTTLLANGYDYHDEVQYVDTINGTDAGWPLGAMMYEAKLLDMGTPSEDHSGYQQDFDYGLMMDAGSSGTRLYVFSWPQRYKHEIPDVQCAPWGKDECYNMKNNSAPLSNYVDNPTGVEFFLPELVAYAEAKVPEHKHKDTPIFLRATAGMRVATEENPDGAAAVLDEVRKILHGTNFIFDDDHADVMPGENEGAFGWISVNYLLTRLQSRPANSGDWSSTVLALDMGGASMQNTFVPSEPSMDHYFPLMIDEERAPLYTHSYLAYGGAQAIQRYRNALTADNKDADNVSDPCLWVGDSFDYVNTDTDKTVTLMGTGNFDDCLSKTKELLLLDTYCAASPCAINGVYQPAVSDKMDVVAMATFSYTADFFNMSGVQALGDFKSIPQDACVKFSWDEIQKIYPTNPYLDAYCFNAAYGYNVMNVGFQLSDDHEINFADAIDGTDVSWALGAMLYEAALMDIHIPLKEASQYWYWIIAAIAVGVVTLLLLFYFKRKEALSNKKDYTSYLDEEDPLNLELSRSSNSPRLM